MDKGQLGSSLGWELFLCLPLGPTFITWRTAFVNLTVRGPPSLGVPTLLFILCCKPTLEAEAWQRTISHF